MRVVLKPLLVVVLAFCCVAPIARGQQYQWTNFVGKPGGQGYVDGQDLTARFMAPTALAIDAAGNVYVTDDTPLLRKISKTGLVSSVKITSSNPEAHAFNLALGLAVDAEGNIYVANTLRDTIHKITPAGAATILAGKTYRRGATDGTGEAASFNGPSGLAVDKAGNLYVADSGGHTIRKISPTGTVVTLAGLAGTSGTADGKGSEARFKNPHGVALDAEGNIYVAEYGNHTLRVINSAGVVRTLAGEPGKSPADAPDGPGRLARFNSPAGVAVDSQGRIYVADTDNFVIRTVSRNGAVTTFAGAVGQQDSNDGAGKNARFSRPAGVAVDAGGQVYVADRENYTVRRISPGAVVTTIAGRSTYRDPNDEGSADVLDSPNGMALDAAGNLIVAVSGLRKITPTGAVTKVKLIVADEVDKGKELSLTTCQMVIDKAGLIYAADWYTQAVWKITPDGAARIFAGSGIPQSSSHVDATGRAARFKNPKGIAINASGTVYVGDSTNEAIRQITPAGVVTTLAGRVGVSGRADGKGAVALFNSPQGLALGPGGDIYVADKGNRAIRKVTPDGMVTTVYKAEKNDPSFEPESLAFDGAGNLFVTCLTTVHKMTPDGVMATIGGIPGVPGNVDGLGTAAQFHSTWGTIVVSPTGVLYFSDTENRRISRGVPVNAPPKAP